MTAAIDWATARGFGFSHVISIGDMIDVDFSDLLDYLALDQLTHAILLYVESIVEAQKFMSAGRIRRDVMMPGVLAVRSSSSILSIHYSRSRRWSSPIGCMAALVI